MNSEQNSTAVGSLAPEPMPDNIRSIQPGGGTISAIELAWGKVRRTVLKTFWPGYCQRMRARIKGDRLSCPVEVVDSRDLKYFVNVANCHFEPQDDPFAWRGRLPFNRSGLAELVLFAGTGIALTIACGFLPIPWTWLAILPASGAVFVFNFFRDPERPISNDPNDVVSPADGKITDVVELPTSEFLEVPTVKIGIFLSVFNVHVNRMSRNGRLIRLRYTPGKFLNALKARSVEENEKMELFFVEPETPQRRFVIRQIAGAIARRIVCLPRTGDTLTKGQRLGMIKFGSRTELLIPAAGFRAAVKPGDKVKGGATIVGRYAD